MKRKDFENRWIRSGWQTFQILKEKNNYSYMNLKGTNELFLIQKYLFKCKVQYFTVPLVCPVLGLVCSSAGRRSYMWSLNLQNGCLNWLQSHFMFEKTSPWNFQYLISPLWPIISGNVTYFPTTIKSNYFLLIWSFKKVTLLRLAILCRFYLNSFLNSWTSRIFVNSMQKNQQHSKSF